MAITPIYGLKDFDKGHNTDSFYANHFARHVKEHAFTHLPHKHDFYLVAIITGGSGWHEIDFKKYRVKPGAVFFMKPGQMHYWKLSPNIKGFVFFHTRAFFEDLVNYKLINEFPFFKSFQKQGCIYLKPTVLKKVLSYFKEILEEYLAGKKYHIQKLQTLVHLVYIELSREYLNPEGESSNRYLQAFARFEELLEANFKKQKLPSFYADKLHVTERHLNRIVRDCVNTTSTNFIAERVILEARRLLVHSELNVTETGYELGFEDKSYFIRFFKKQTGLTPLAFLKQYN